MKTKSTKSTGKQTAKAKQQTGKAKSPAKSSHKMSMRPMAMRKGY